MTNKQDVKREADEVFKNAQLCLNTEQAEGRKRDGVINLSEIDLMLKYIGGLDNDVLLFRKRRAYKMLL